MGDEQRKPRIAEPQRKQGVIRFEMPEDTLPPTHAARVLWDVVGTLQLCAFLEGVKAFEGTRVHYVTRARVWVFGVARRDHERQIDRLPRAVPGATPSLANSEFWVFVE